MDKDKLTWMGRPILSEAHADHLERDAALREFKDGWPRAEAEKQAYEEYKKKHHREAAAHHLRGMRAAQATNDLDQAAIHGEAYHHHMSKLGHDSLGEVPEEIKNLVEGEDRKPQYKFKSHGADRLLLD